LIRYILTIELLFPWNVVFGKKTLERKDKIRNTKLARKRVVFEHTICQLKKYQILSQVYRSREEDYNKNLINIAALYNFKLNFKKIYLNPN